MSQPPSNESSANPSPDFNFWSQPFSRLQQLLLFQDSTYRSLFSYFLDQPIQVEPTATSQIANSATATPTVKSDTCQSPFTYQTSSNRGESHRLHLPSTLPTPAEKEAFFMSSAIQDLEHRLENRSYFTSTPQVVDVNIDRKEANYSKTALNDYPESSQLPQSFHQEMAQMRAELKQLREANEQAQSKQTERIQELHAETQTLKAENRTLQSNVSELHARMQAQDKTLANYRGSLRAIEAAFGEFRTSQTKRIDCVEATYQHDKVEAGKRQQAKDEQMDLHLKNLIDPMLAEAVEKAIRLLRRDGRHIPIPAQQPSTPSINHLYDHRVYRQKQAN